MSAADASHAAPLVKILTESGLRKADIPGEEEALRFLARRGLSFEEIRPLCMPEEGGLPQGRPRLPVERPPTRVDFERPHPPPRSQAKPPTHHLRVQRQPGAQQWPVSLTRPPPVTS